MGQPGRDVTSAAGFFLQLASQPAYSWLPENFRLLDKRSGWKSTRKMDILKGKVHPKMKIPSLSIHRHADGKLDEVS